MAPGKKAGKKNAKEVEEEVEKGEKSPKSPSAAATKQAQTTAAPSKEKKAAKAKTKKSKAKKVEDSDEEEDTRGLPPAIDSDDDESEEEEDIRPKGKGRAKGTASMFSMLSIEDEDEPPKKAAAKAKKSTKKAKKTEADEEETPAQEETAAPAKMSKIEKRAAQQKKKAARKKKQDEEEGSSSEEEEEPTTRKGRKAAKSAAKSDGKKSKKKSKADDDDIRDWPAYVRLKESGANAKKRLIRDIKADDFSIQVPGQVLIKQASLTLVEGQSYGVLGRNGIGKSVLLKRLAHREEPFDKVPDYIRILFVEQEITGDDTTPLDSVLHADEEREWLLKEEKRLLEKERIEEEKQAKRDARAKAREEAIAKGETPPPEEEEEEEEVEERSYDLRDIYERLREIDSAKAEARAATILAGLGFNLWDIRNKTTKEFSGGWRMRIALARALFVCPDLLILDEPTNHLDLNAVIWLESYLENWKKTLLVVSHERVFLSAVAKNIIHFHNQTLTTYKGDYYVFLKVRAANQRSQARAVDAQERKVKKLKEFINKDKNKGGGQANSRKLMLKNMEKINVDTDDALIKFEFPEPLSLGCGEGVSILRFEEVSFSYSPDKPKLFHNLDFGLDLESRVALVGPNGVGKSTVLKLMSGQLEPTTGYVYRHRNLAIARFSQHHVDQLNMQMNPVEYLQSHFPDAQTQDVRKHLGGFGLPGKLALTSIDKLSGGQKSRVVLAELSWRKPHILLLDEPTNHLDIEMIDSLGEALKNFGGGLVLVSHNQRLIELCCNQLWVVGKDGTVKRFDGEFEDYKQQVIDEINQLTLEA